MKKVRQFWSSVDPEARSTYILVVVVMIVLVIGLCFFIWQDQHNRNQDDRSSLPVQSTPTEALQDTTNEGDDSSSSDSNNSAGGSGINLGIGG